MKSKGHHPCFLESWQDLKNDFQHEIEGIFFLTNMQGRFLKPVVKEWLYLLPIIHNILEHTGNPTVFLIDKATLGLNNSGQGFVNCLSREI